MGLIPVVLFLSREKEPMTLHQLSVWIVVAKHQSVTKTADELHIRQPTVSIQIKSLQKECGIKLYKAYRGKGVELTQAGRLLLKHAKLILLQVKIIEKKLKISRGEEIGRDEVTTEDCLYQWRLLLNLNPS